jgi:hypothetical protein
VACFEWAKKKRPQLSGASWGRVGLEMCRIGVTRHDSDLGWRSVLAINFCVRVAYFEITSGLFRTVPEIGYCPFPPLFKVNGPLRFLAVTTLATAVRCRNLSETEQTPYDSCDRIIAPMKLHTANETNRTL